MHFHKCEIVIYILCQAVIVQSSDLSGSDYDEITTTEQTEEEWHMDFMPTGYLPDSVYRELAWYGILQIQPLHHSSKHKVAAQLIWQHTLGRPHVIMENPPQSTQSPGKVSRQILAEEAAKWSREQRAAQEVLMENIKSGGNGLTVRTVVSAHTKTIYIIQNGNYYKCPEESEPDLDAYRVQANMHERKCTYGKSSISVPVDPCIEAEMAPIEYSFHEGWMFCLGNGERENNYFQNGTLDCGNKTKVAVNEFLDLCAIDNNIVITFDYFGDEPRKDMMHNATLCTSWDPCRLSYLYRLEPPPAEMTPSFPTSTPNPCETTVCDECIEGYTEEGGVVINDSAESQPSPVEFEEKGNGSKLKLWISGTNEEAGIHNEYWLYTRKNRNYHELLEKRYTKSVRSPYNISINYKPSKDTYVIAHGWLNKGTSDVNTLIKEALLDVQDCNVIVLDWGYITQNLNYIAAANGVLGVGKALGVFLKWLVKEKLADWNKMHLIGFSLGAHVVGVAGRHCGGRPRRVTGLDPALPKWRESNNTIDRNSGQYVEIIHTNGGVYGIINPVGHADFYPNGGSGMPGCVVDSCCHSRSYELFASSIRQPHRFAARHCNDLHEARKAECNGPIQYMGNADMKKNGVGLYALTTDKKWPF